MKKLVLIPFLTACLAGTASAALHQYTFDFTGLSNGADINSYMTSHYVSSVTISGAIVKVNPSNPSAAGYWTGKTAGDPFIWTSGSNTASMEIDFAVPIAGMQFDGFTFANTGPVDFQVIAYGADGELVYRDFWNPGAGLPVSQTWIDFTAPVNRLWFSDGGQHDIGVDNLVVSAVPLPGSILLGVFAVGLAGRKLRQFV